MKCVCVFLGAYHEFAPQNCTHNFFFFFKEHIRNCQETFKSFTCVTSKWQQFAWNIKINLGMTDSSWKDYSCRSYTISICSFPVFCSAFQIKKISQLPVLAANKQGGSRSQQSHCSYSRLPFSDTLSRLTAHAQCLGKRARYFKHVTLCAIQRLLQKHPFGKDWRLSSSRIRQHLWKFFTVEVYEKHFAVSKIKMLRRAPHISGCLTKLWNLAHMDREPKGQFLLWLKHQSPDVPLGNDLPE